VQHGYAAFGIFRVVRFMRPGVEHVCFRVIVKVKYFYTFALEIMYYNNTVDVKGYLGDSLIFNIEKGSPETELKSIKTDLPGISIPGKSNLTRTTVGDIDVDSPGKKESSVAASARPRHGALQIT
jgi:hypothetical protein